MWRLAAILIFAASCQVPQSSKAPAPAAEPLVTHTQAASDPKDERLTVLLHGYGSNELDLVGLAPKLGLHGELVSYRAPEKAGRGYAWFPIEFTPDGTRYAADAADEPLTRLAGDLRRLRRDREGPVVVVGFSQGAMMAMLLAAEHPDTVDAAVALSGGLPREPQPLEDAAPVFMAHGQADHVVPLQRAQQAKAWLAEGGVDVELMEVPGLEHRTHPKALARGASWLARHCPERGCGRGANYRAD